MLTPYEAIEVVRKLSGFMYYDLDGYLPTDPTLFAITLHDQDLNASATAIEYQFDKITNDLTKCHSRKNFNLFFVLHDKIYSSFNLEDITINNKEDLEKFLLDIKYKLKLAKEELRLSRLKKDFE